MQQIIHNVYPQLLDDKDILKEALIFMKTLDPNGLKFTEFLDRIYAASMGGYIWPGWGDQRGP